MSVALPYSYVPDQFLPRFKPPIAGTMPKGRFATRWFGRITRDRIPIVVLSKRPIGGESLHLAGDRLGRWVAYRHDRNTGKRRLTGKSIASFYLERAFGLL